MPAVRRPARRHRPLLPAAERVHQLIDLATGELRIIGRLTDASNATFLCDLVGEDGAHDTELPQRVVYKPTRGERPLEDFPLGTLANREVAAFVLSEATGWGIVPRTLKRDGPFGPGMVQLWIDADDDADVVSLIVQRDSRLRRVCVFDALANNADRKGGHLIVTGDGRVQGVDHGICFAVAPKLRTVLWGWAGEPLSGDELSIVRSVCDGLDGPLARELGQWLAPEEVRATARRAVRLLEAGRFPQPDPRRPSVPWPPF